MAEHTPTAADWQNAIDNLSPEDREFLHRPLVEDVWHNAIVRFPDTKPLADLLRTTIMPPAIQNLLADYLDGDPDIVGGRLVYKPAKTFQQTVEMIELVKDYHDEVDRRRRAGEKDASQGAAVSVGEKTSQSDSSVYRKVRAWRSMAKSIVAWIGSK